MSGSDVMRPKCNISGQETVFHSDVREEISNQSQEERADIKYDQLLVVSQTNSQ